MSSAIINPNQLEKDAGDRMIEVLLKDKETGEITGRQIIKRALLAKLMQPITAHQISAQNGKFVLEV